MKGAVKAILVAVMALLLSGCFLVEMNLTVSAEDNVSGSMTFAIEESAAGALSELSGDDESIINADDLPEGATSEPYEQDGYVGQTVTFADVPLEEFNSSMQQDGGTFSLVREGDEFVFTGTIDLAGNEAAAGGSGAPGGEGFEEAIAQALASGSMTLSMTFPGEITDTNGEVDGTTVTWDLADLLNESEVYATAAADESAASDGEAGPDGDSSAADGADSSFPVLPVVLGVVAAIIIIGGAAYLITRRGRA